MSKINDMVKTVRNKTVKVWNGYVNDVRPVVAEIGGCFAGGFLNGFCTAGVSAVVKVPVLKQVCAATTFIGMNVVTVKLSETMKDWAMEQAESLTIPE